MLSFFPFICSVEEICKGLVLIAKPLCAFYYDALWLMQFFLFFFLIFIVYLAAPGLSCSMWDLVPWPGIEPGTPALGAQSLNHWASREVPDWCSFKWKWWTVLKIPVKFLCLLLSVIRMTCLRKSSLSLRGESPVELMYLGLMTLKAFGSSPTFKGLWLLLGTAWVARPA